MHSSWECTLKSKNNFSFQHCIMLFLVLKWSASRSGSFGAYLIKICCVVFMLCKLCIISHTFCMAYFYIRMYNYSTAILIIYFRVHSQREHTLVRDGLMQQCHHLTNFQTLLHTISIHVGWASSNTLPSPDEFPDSIL